MIPLTQRTVATPVKIKQAVYTMRFVVEERNVGSTRLEDRLRTLVEVTGVQVVSSTMMGQHRKLGA
jgi:hypothetical protein